MQRTSHTSTLLLLLLATIFLSFLYIGIINRTPTSLDYNVPIAKTILSGEFLTLQSNNPYLYFPGSSHYILAVFLFLGLPNLFGLLGWVALFFSSKKLGSIFGLSSNMAFIFAATICTSTTVIRTISDQSIDKWLCVWFVLALAFLEKPERSIRYFLLLGLFFGLFIGTKFSSPLFFLPLVIVYAGKLIPYLNLARALAGISTFTVSGLFWYLRNFFLERNPMFPANLPFLKGFPGFTAQDTTLIRIPFEYPQGILALLSSYLSEYLIFSLSILVIIWFVIHQYRSKKKLELSFKRLWILTLLVAVTSLLLPITDPFYIDIFHIISNMRYIMVFVVLTTLGVFLIADKYRHNETLTLLAVLNTIFIFSFVPYVPKIFVAVAAIFAWIQIKNPLFVRKYFT